jgi:phosphoglycerate dehydrogenase-like enzyme
LIAALDKKDGLFGAALDVTDPEPLPDKHPLWTHPKVIVTPHVSGNTEGEMDIATEICIENIRRINEGEKVVNEVDFTRGY